MLIFKFVLCAVVVVPVAIHAQTVRVPPKSAGPNEAVMKNEGDSFLGVPFVVTFPGDMPPCPIEPGVNIPKREVIKTMSGACYFQKAANRFDILNGPDLGIGHSVELTTYRGYPALFVLTVARASFTQMGQVFSSRYGPAHSSDVNPAYNKAGETFQVQRLHWIGKKMTVLLDEFGSGDIRWSSALVTSRFAEELRDAEKKRAVETAAGLL